MGVAHSVPSMSRPNIIVCLCDQMRAFEAGCYGHPVCRTPAIDALAANGVRFEVAVSNNPVCTPGRSCLLSGQYSRTCTGLICNETDEAPPFTRPRFPSRVLPEVLRDNGYRTALIGKWHIGSHPGLMGFDHYTYPKFHHLNRHQMYFDRTHRAFDVPGYAEDFNQQNMGEFLAAMKGSDQPFFAFYNIATPHMPFFDVPPEYQEMYAADEVPLRDNVFIDGQVAGNPEWRDGTHWWEVYMWAGLAYQLKVGMELPDDFTLKDLYARYCGMVSYTDHHVGLLMQQLREAGLEEDTVVVFASDHGDILGSHHRYNKDQLWEEAIRVPMVFHWPAKLTPRTVDTQVASLIDVMPTVLSAAGIEVPEDVQGQDLMPVLSGERADLDRNMAFIETSNWKIGVRTLTELYGVQLERTENREVDGVRLTAPAKEITDEHLLHFDCVADPFQVNNLASAESDAAGDLRQALMEWNTQTPWLEQPVKG